MRRIAFLSGLILLFACAAMPAWAQKGDRSAEEQAVRAVVTDFGKKLRQVSTLAPKPVAAANMAKAYAGLIAPALLVKWKANPTKAPGKQTSSPSPERIDITAVVPRGRDAYAVTGKVILLTDQERKNGGIFQANPVSMTVARRHGKWLITTYDERQPKP